MNIAIGTDHAGYEEPPPYYKPAFEAHVIALGHDVVDCGTNGPEAVDYPDIANRVAEAILSGAADSGIILCGTGIGISIAANRHPGIRAAVCTTPDMARLAKEHNNANVLAVGRRNLTLEECLSIIDTWLATPFSDAPRHRRRVEKMG